MIEQPPVPKEFFDRIWEMKVHFLRAKFAKWKDQRVYFKAEEGSLPWRILEKYVKDPDHLPQGPIIVNAIYDGQIYRRPEGYFWGEHHDRHTVMGFRDVLYEWVNRKGERCTMMSVSTQNRHNNKRFVNFHDIEEVLTGGLSLKRMRAGIVNSGWSLAGGAKATGHHDNGGEVEVSGSVVPCPKRTPAPRSLLVSELEKWGDAKLKK